MLIDSRLLLAAWPAAGSVPKRLAAAPGTARDCRGRSRRSRGTSPRRRTRARWSGPVTRRPSAASTRPATTTTALIPASRTRKRRAAATSTSGRNDGVRRPADILHRHRPALERVVAGGLVAVAEAAESRLVDVAVPSRGTRAARVEAAACRRVDRARHVALEHDRLAAAARAAGSGSARPTAARRCTGASARRRAARPLPISATLPRYITSTRSEMCRTTLRSCAMNTYVSPNSRCRSLSRFRICACTETSSAETGSSQTISFGFDGERAGDADPLALAARELVREAVVVLRVETDDLEQLLHAALALGVACRCSCTSSGSPTMKPTRLRGFSEAYGSWKTIIISRRTGRISARERFVMSTPSKMILPPVGSSRRMMQRAIVDLPQPDSPTTPSVSPGRP